ncbi:MULTISPECIES: helix-turn-helix domain-containing protein [Sphingomonas]|uniref:helix-turn-helix domain-containing protein n=1 Tax=Sphingomonas TaxID=13687 RepID=UPI001269D7BE|nr:MULTISPECIES: helix-turn-helix domain-containing protein [Sphingomonas]
MQYLFKTQLKEQKALIRSCMLDGVGIEGLDDMPAFRFVPPAETARFKEGQSAYAKPSRRSYAAHKCRNRGCACHKSKWYRHAPMTLAGDYLVPMAGDDCDLSDARKAYHNGEPQPLRDWHLEAATERAERWAAIDAAEAVASLARALGRFAGMSADDRRAALRKEEVWDMQAAWEAVIAVAEIAKAVAALPTPVMPVEPVAVVRLPSVLDRWRGARTIEEPKRPVSSPDRPSIDDSERSPHSVTMSPVEFRNIRLSINMTQEELAQWGGVTVRSIKRWEAGAQPVPRIWDHGLRGLLRSKVAA